MVYEQLRLSLSRGASLDLSTTAAIGQSLGEGGRGRRLRKEEKARRNEEGELGKGRETGGRKNT